MTSASGGATGSGDPFALVNLLSSSWLQEFDDCSRATEAALPEGSVGNCRAPMVCHNDSTATNPSRSGLVCEFPCRQTADCPDPATVCSLGFCVLNGCDPDAGNLDPLPANASVALLDHCAGAGASDGTCLNEPRTNGYLFQSDSPLLDFNFTGPLRVCVRAGTADGGCLPPQGGSSPQTTCPQSAACAAWGLPLSSQSTYGFSPMHGLNDNDTYGVVGPQYFPGEPNPYVGTCLQACGPSDGGSACPSGVCIYPLAGGPGVCANTAGGPTVGLAPVEFAYCGLPGDGTVAQPEACGFPLRCTNAGRVVSTHEVDANAQIIFVWVDEFLCQARCSQTSDCPSAFDVCNPATGFCDPAPADAGDQCWPGAVVNGPAFVQFGAGGTASNTTQRFSLCVPAGAATAACGFEGDGGRCEIGSGCFGGVCRPFCDATSAIPQCGDGGLACVPYGEAFYYPTSDHLPPSFYGVCASQCAGARATCQQNGDCCSAQCANGVCLACANDGVTCADATNCCSGSCLAGQCNSAACLPTPSGCNQNRDCCSGFCIDGSCNATVCYADAGTACKLNSDCCSTYCLNGACSNDSCLSATAACGVDGDCCSHHCNGNACQ